MKDGIDNEVSKKLSILVNQTVKEIPGVKRIYLFGSYAYGKPTGESDFDLMVITEKEIEDILSLETEIRYKTWGKVGLFDMLVYSEQIFNRRKNNYKLERKIFNEGKILYERV